MEMLQYAFMQKALLAGLLVAIICPMIGMFIVIRRQSMMGDGLGHIAFAGVTGAALLGITPLWGALVLTVGSAVGIELLRRRHMQFADMSLALFFYAGLAIAVVCSTLSNMPSANILSFLFGSILTATWESILQIGIATVVIIGLFAWKWTDLLLASFDTEVAEVAGIHTNRIHMIFAILIAVVIVMGMSIVGILLISALMIIPVAAAHLWKRGFKTTLYLAIGYSVLSMILGLWSAFVFDLAPGGSIVLTALILYVITMFGIMAVK